MGEGAAILRPGGVTAAAIDAVIGPLAPMRATAPSRSPGMLTRHYAPSRPLRLERETREPARRCSASGRTPRRKRRSISAPAAISREAAANLFAMLRALDRPEFAAIAVMPIPEDGLGRGDQRSAAPRRRPR